MPWSGAAVCLNASSVFAGSLRKNALPLELRGAPVGEKFYTLKLTSKELWHLRESYEASFTDPDSRNAVEIAISVKLGHLSIAAHKAERRSR